MNKLRNYVRELKQSGEDIKIPRQTQESDEFPTPREITELKADIIEDNGEFGIKTVEITQENSGFAYFLDGIERKKILCYYKSVPLIYGYVAAAILGRTDKKMHSIGLEKSEQNFYVIDKTFENLEINTVKISDGTPMLPDQYIKAAHSAIQTSRGNLEHSLIRDWIKAGYEDGWLFVDGRIEKLSKDITSGQNIVGIIKSHQACYFDFEDQYKIYSMKKGERSSVFQPEKENVYSWYLRLHYDKNYGNNEFGLIRVEVPAEKEYLEKADLISSWILLETKPIAFPASRWDRMIYPIKYCEDYLKSKAPSYKGLSL
ncbi:MAG: hypothetical protein A2Y25_07040 [Candidatus Melainabacteria bacterium GWF2_37_15]|nr:MAG: hypothetical protein A2Y25_07040 [Candidatus Melainabacteria bacterium GWF2_37_15]